MRKIALTFLSCLLAMLLLLPNADPAASQQRKEGEKSDIKKFEDTLPPFKVSTFSGNESRIHAIYLLLSNCATSGRPDVRIAKKPENGEIRFDPIKIPANAKAGSALAHCNGKEVDALGVFYKSKDNFIGEDRISLDVDYKSGFIHRYSYIVDVR